MVLKYLGCRDSASLAQYYEAAGLVVGQAYEVAEIFEAEGQLMVRPVGAERWPPPGHPFFGLQPEYFEPTDKPIPIVSCGFRHNSYLTDFLGALLTQPEHIELIRELERVDLPDEEERFARWVARAARDLSREAAQAYFELLKLPVPCDMGIIEQVYLVDEPLPERFAYIGCYLAELGRHDVRRATFETRLGDLLNALEIRGFEIGEIGLSFWQGTAGGERLINAPPDGRLIYGTLNQPLADEAAEE